MSGPQLFSIYLYLPSRIIRKVTVHGKMPLGSLSSVLPPVDLVLIYDSAILEHFKTFNFYGIKEGDVIVVLSKNESDEDTKMRWIQATSDDDEIIQRVHMAMNPSLTKEVARLKDLHLARVENRRKMFYQVAKKAKYEHNLSDGYVPDKKSETVIGETPDFPSTDPLPIFDFPTDPVRENAPVLRRVNQTIMPEADSEALIMTRIKKK